MLYIVPEDVLYCIWRYLHTSDLARVDTIIRVPESIWTYAIRQRCGPLWPRGRAGVARLYSAVHASPTHTVYDIGTFLCASERTAAAVQSLAGVHMWHQRSIYYPCRIGRAACACVVDDTSVAVGNEYGLMLYPSCTQLWSVAGVVSVSRLHDGSLWFCSADQRAYCYRDGDVQNLPCALVLCVSGPVGMAGTMQGTYPIRSLPLPCCRIVQSATLACAWFVDGHVCTFRSGYLLHVIDTGVRAPLVPLSVVGDVFCLDGMAYRDGKLHLPCPRAERVCTFDGYHALVRLRCGRVGIT